MIVEYSSFAKQFVQLQPMCGPSGLIFYLDYEYGLHAEFEEGSGSSDNFVMVNDWSRTYGSGDSMKSIVDELSNLTCTMHGDEIGSIEGHISIFGKRGT